jgi:hypothetical protein
LSEDKSFTQDVVKHIDVDMISLHDYSKSKENAEDSLPTLLNDLNKLVDDEIEIVYFTPKEITIFQVLHFFNFHFHQLIVICTINIIIIINNLGNKQKIKKAYWFNKYCL